LEAPSEAQPITPERWRPNADTLLVLLLVFFHCTQASFKLFAGEKGGGLNLSVADFLIPIALFVWLVSSLRRGSLRLPPLGFPLLAAAWLGLSLLKFLKGGEDIVVRSRGIVDVFQFVEYFIIAYLLFANCLTHPEARRWALRLLGMAVIVSLVAAAAQYFSSAPALKVRGAWYEDRNTFGAFLAMTLPLLFGVSVFSKSSTLRIWTAVLIAACLCVCLSGGAYLAVGVGLLTVAALKRPVKLFMTAAILLALSLYLLPRLPRSNSEVLLDSVALYATDDRFHTFGEDVPKIQERVEAKQRALAGKIASEDPVGFTDLPTEEDHSWKWRQRYKEWQAGLNMMSRSPLFGVGIGAYQKNVNNFYGSTPKYPVNLMEPNTQSLYMIWGASAGVPFLIILFGMLMRAATSARRCLREMKSRFDRGVAAGLLGSLASLLVVAVFADPMVRGLGMTFAFLLGLTQALRSSLAARNGPKP
jgi:hypothetical protein